MLTKTQPDEIQDYLSDASYLNGGTRRGVVFPETVDEVAKILAEATRTQTPVTISGAGTGTVAGRVPFGGIVIATDKLNRIKSVSRQDGGGTRDRGSRRSPDRSAARGRIRRVALSSGSDGTKLLYRRQYRDERFRRANFQVRSNPKICRAIANRFGDWRRHRSSTRRIARRSNSLIRIPLPSVDDHRSASCRLIKCRRFASTLQVITSRREWT